MGRAIGVWFITFVAVAAAFAFVEGVGFAGGGYSFDLPGVLGSDKLVPTLVFSAILALINSFVKPILKVLTLPINILTLGLFALVLNTGLIYLVHWLGNSFFNLNMFINSFWSALGASIIISIVTAILGAITGLNKKSRKSRSASQ
ncbi:MAG: phage holin family protein [Coriobacteriales bacterium]|jgi:putative membrane protein|nr:phage holin family protein [Coriobacteriales bacterium]